ncbi:MAG: glycoside hydrolase family 16 protein [Chitinispirillaceae bacterium]|nr:glycoside hydrolase family 16 protein [Chitinispirillaceae bacterium]
MTMHEERRLLRRCILTTALFIALLHLSASAEWELVWSDEFDYTGLPDTTRWGYDVGGGGWGNQELQYYTEKDTGNARVGNGVLTITAIKEKVGQNTYSSARLITKNKGDWLYGRFEIAATLPKGVGLWPAIWMLPTDNAYGIWPKSGEIDIMENVGFEPNIVHFTVHTESYNHSIGTSRGASATLADPYTAFVVYALEWYEDRMVFFADNNRTFSFRNEGGGSKVWPFDKRFHVLLNIAVGGTWGGQQGVDEDICPAEMIVDYVRVYRYNSTAVNAFREGTLHRRPAATRGGNRLTICTKHPAVTAARIFSVDGKTAAEYPGGPPASCGSCVVPLLPGAYIAVVNEGATHRAVRFTEIR